MRAVFTFQGNLIAFSKFSLNMELKIATISAKSYHEYLENYLKSGLPSSDRSPSAWFCEADMAKSR